ncbi:hypothetical protein BJ742DRAFT_808130 [Cladochytrium replicatum]|nr:hypothetical protein BJ742DRAFT_808130 [Cladochytrium replicatum]
MGLCFTSANCEDDSLRQSAVPFRRDFFGICGMRTGGIPMWKWLYATRGCVLVTRLRTSRTHHSLHQCLPSPSKTHYCPTRETCSTSNGTAVCIQGCLVGSAQGDQACGDGCVPLGRACCGSSSTRLWTCGAGGKCDNATSGCLAFGTNAQEAGREIGSKVVTPANPITGVQSPSQSSAGSGSSSTSPANGASGGSGNSNSNNSNNGDNSGTVAIILVVLVAVVDSLVTGFLGFMCIGYKGRVSKIEKVLPKPLMARQTFSTNVPMYPPAVAAPMNGANAFIAAPTFNAKNSYIS